MRSRIFFFDLDGTLLNSRKELSPGNRAALDAALAQGHRVVIATGRALPDALRLARRLELDGDGCYVLSYNGAVIYDCTQKKVIYGRALDRSAMEGLYREAHKRNLHIQTYDDKSILLEPQYENNAEIRYYCGVQSISCRIIPSLEAVEQPVYKVLLIDLQDRERLEAFSRWVNETYRGILRSFFSSSSYLEVVDAHVDKGEAVARLCALLGYCLQDSVAAGDQENDIPMIRRAGLGVCMQNGIDAAKQCADYITVQDNDHDGVAEMIWKVLSNQL